MEAPVISPPALFHHSSVHVETTQSTYFFDLTDDVVKAVRTSGILQGLVVVASRYTTAGIVVNEHEPELLKDLEEFLDALAPQAGDYLHNAAPCGPGERPNGHAHCQALLLNTSASLPLVNGSILLGRYQRIFLVELDGPRRREVSITLLGGR